MSNREGFYEQTGVFPLSFLERWIQKGTSFIQHWFSDQHRVTRRVMASAILILALLAFELFNFDTTEFALEDLLGPTSFAGLRWATILAIAFCSIDFAGLARLIMPDEGMGTRSDGRFMKPTWLLLGAWLLGGGMNAIMTWWAVSLALMGHNLGNEVLTRGQLLRGVPIFVAVLVWVTRILIISSFTATNDSAADRSSRQSAALLDRRNHAARPPRARVPRPTSQPVVARAASEPVYVGAEETARGQTGGVPSTRRPKMPRPPRGPRPEPVPMRMRDRGR